MLDGGEEESMVERKRERLQLQLGEARQLRRSIARRSLKVSRGIIDRMIQMFLCR